VDTPTVAPPAEGMAADAVDLSAAARLPFAGTPEDEAHLAAENQATWKLLEEHRLNPARPPSGRGYRRTADRVVSTTDADALPLQTGARAALGYRDHYVVDGGEARIILAALVTAGDVMDNTPMLDLLHRVRFRWHLHPKRAVGDAKYGTIENIRALEDTDIRAYVPRPDLGERPSSFGASRFTDDAERDEYRCPQDEPLRKVRTKYTEAVTVYQAAATACNPCPLKAQCTPSTHGRPVSLLPRRVSGPRPRLSPDHGLPEGDAQTSSLGGTTLRGGEGLAWLTPLPLTTALESELRRITGRGGTEPQALAHQNRLGTPLWTGREPRPLLWCCPVSPLSAGRLHRAAPRPGVSQHLSMALRTTAAR
jgi:hypothetical protein